MEFLVKRMMLFAACVCMFYLYCSSTTDADSKSQFDPPEDHTISKQGALHKPGYQEPMKDCFECHGDDLRGGMVQVSCFTCHGKKW